MVLLLILLLMIVLITVFLILAVSVGGSIAIILFGDVIVCVFILVWLVKKLTKKK